MEMPLKRTRLSPLSEFSFRCARCSQCCRDKKIQVNPYEIARIAGNRGISTSDCIARFTRDGGTYLSQDEKGDCVFQGPDGCSIHPDRPLVCRLYPLGRQVNGLGDESFSEVDPIPPCPGERNAQGTIAEYLAAQETGPFVAAADEYLRLFIEVGDIVLGAARGSKDQNRILALARRSPAGAGAERTELLDMDAAVSTYCAARDIPFPVDVEQKTLCHIQAVRSWAESIRRLQGESSNEEQRA